MSDVVEGFLPLHRQVSIALLVPSKRKGQAPLPFQLMVGPRKQFAHRVIRKKIRCGPMGVDFPGGSLRAILAELQRP